MNIQSLLSRLGLHGREIVSGAAIVLILRILGSGVQLLFSILVARFFGADGLGVYALAFTVTTITAVIARLGIDQALLRFVAIHAAEDQWARLKGFMIRGAWIIIASGSVLTTLLFLSSAIVSGHLFNKPELILPLRLMALTIVPFSLINLLAECLRAIKRIRDCTLVQGVLPPLLACVLLVPIYFIGVGILGAVVAYVCSVLIVIIAGWRLWQRAIREHWAVAPLQVSSSELLRVSIPMAWVAAVSMLMGYSDVLILGVFRSVGDVGIFNAALKIAGLLSFVLIAGNAILAPKVASLYQQGEIATVNRLARFSTMMMIFLAAVPAVILLGFPDWVMGLFGQTFSRGATALVILTMGQLVNVATGPVGVLLLMTGHERSMRRRVMVAATIQVLLGLSLIPQFGIIGAATSAALGMALLNILALIAVKKRLNISLFPWIKGASVTG